MNIVKEILQEIHKIEETQKEINNKLQDVQNEIKKMKKGMEKEFAEIRKELVKIKKDLEEEGLKREKMEMSRDIQIACFKEMIKGMEILDM